MIFTSPLALSQSYHSSLNDRKYCSVIVDQMILVGLLGLYFLSINMSLLTCSLHLTQKMKMRRDSKSIVFIVHLRTNFNTFVKLMYINMIFLSKNTSTKLMLWKRKFMHFKRRSNHYLFILGLRHLSLHVMFKIGCNFFFLLLAKIPDKIWYGRPTSIKHVSIFIYEVYILNTKDHLRKVFD